MGASRTSYSEASSSHEQRTFVGKNEVSKLANHKSNYHKVKMAQIILANTLMKPRAVVIHSQYTLATIPTMSSSQRPFQLECYFIVSNAKYIRRITRTRHVGQ